MTSTLSPLCLINGNPQLGGANVSPGSTVTVALASSVGVNQWSLTVFGTDELIGTPPTIVYGANFTATFTAPNYQGSAIVFQSTINNQVDYSGNFQASYATTMGVYTLTADGYRVGALGETLEGSTYGWSTKLNPIIRGEGITITLGGDVTGPSFGNTVSKIQGVTISGTPSAGYVLEATSASAASWQAPSGGITLAGAVTGPANSNAITLTGNSSITGVLPAANQSAQTMGGAVGGTTAASTINLTGNASVSGALPIANLAPGTSAQVLMSNGTPATTWTTLSGDMTVSAAGAVTVVAIQGNAVQSGALGAAQDGYVLTWQNGAAQNKWLPSNDAISLSGDVTGAANTNTVVKIQGNTITSGALTEGNLLIATSTSNWASTAVTGDVAFSAGTPGATTVTLAGDVTGRVGTTVVGKIQGNTVTSGALTEGQFLVASSTSNWAATSLSGDLSESATTPGKVSVVSLTGAAGSIPVASTGNIITWATATTAPGLAQTAAVSGAGASITIAPQAATTTGASGSVIANVAAPASGTTEAGFTFQRASTSLVTIQALIGTTSSGALYMAGVTPSATNYALVGSSTITNLNGSTGCQLAAAGSVNLSITASLFQWAHSIASPVFNQAAITSDAAAQTFTISAQSAYSGAVSNITGGTLALSSGSGVAAGSASASEAAGRLQLQAGGNTEMAFDGYGIALAHTTGISLTSQSSITLTAAEMLTPYLAFTGTVGAGGCTVTLPESVISGFTRWWKADISALTLTGSVTFQVGTGATVVTISSLTTNANVVDIYSPSANVLLANL